MSDINEVGSSGASSITRVTARSRDSLMVLWSLFGSDYANDFAPAERHPHA